METQVTTGNAAAAVGDVGDVGGVGADADGFGTRPSSGRPHSIRLDGGTVAAEPRPVSRGLDVLVGVGIGAAAMYYLDPAAGSRRRARVRDTTASATAEWSGAARVAAVTIGAVLTVLAGRRRDPMGAAAGVLGSALLAGGVKGGGRARRAQS